MKMTMEKRLAIAKEYFSDKTSITKLAKKYDTEKGKVQYYVSPITILKNNPIKYKERSYNSC